MRVNSADNTAFKRAIKVTTPKSRGIEVLNKNTRVPSSIMNVMNTMRGQTSIYGKETSRKMGEFLSAQIGDYDRETGIYARKIQGEDYIFTGKDAVKAREIVENSKLERERINERYRLGPNENSSPSERVKLSDEGLHRIYIQNTYLKTDEDLLELVKDDSRENGGRLHITFEEGVNAIAKEVCYKNFGPDLVFDVKTGKVAEEREW